MTICACLSLFAGNPDRTGQAGAYELLINPYAKSAGLHSLNTAAASGVEAMRLNIAGLGRLENSELVFTNSQWFAGSGIQVNNLGFGTKVGDSAVFGIEVFTFDFGTIDYTTYENPEGNIGTYRPMFMNIGISYAKQFSKEITAGITLRSINESIGNVSASGLVIDAGVQYLTGKYDHFRFGAALRNIGLPIKFDGDGLATKVTLGGNDFQQTLQQRANYFELPSLMHIGLAYDFINRNMAGSKGKGGWYENKDAFRLTAVANFQSNSFTNDELGAGIEFSIREKFTLRGAYRWSEQTVYLNNPESTFGFSGPSAGMSIALPLEAGKMDKSLSLDYGYRHTNIYKGVHTAGITLKF